MCIRHDTLQLLKWTEPLSSPNFHSGGEGGEGPSEEGGTSVLWKSQGKASL